MRQRRTFVLAMAALLMALPAGGVQSTAALTKSPAPVESPGPSPRIVNGVFTGGYPTVGALVTPSNPLLASTYCSGTMIGCETFLTAAHCVCDATGSQCQPGGAAEPDPSDFGVFLQHAGFFEVASIAVHPSFDFPTADFAVLKLGRPVTAIPPTVINTVQSPPDGSTATIVGFGRSGGGNFDYGLKRAGKVVTEVTGCDVDQVCWQFESPLGPPGEDSNTCNADSGGPLFWDAGSGDVIAATTSGGINGACDPTDFSYDANVFSYRSFIQAEAGADLGQTSCGSGPQVGDPDVAVTAIHGNLATGNTSDTWPITVSEGASALRIALNASEQSGADFDLYVKQGSPPTTSDFDCKSDGPSQYGYCEIAHPAVGTWNVLVSRFAGSGDYQVTATVITSGCHPGNEGSPCDDGNACTGGDTCASSVCVGTPITDGTPCDDGDLCTSVDLCQAGACVGSETPHADCAVPIAPKASTIVMKDLLGGDRDLMTWSWRRGPATTKAAFGNPASGAAHDLCVYDESAGASSVIYSLHVPAGAAWDESAAGYDYADSSGAAGGLHGLSFRASPIDGRSRIAVSLKGSELVLPDLPLGQDDQVVVQLVGENACWGASFSTSTSNLADHFRARSD